jgi:hypothetical protein
MDWDKQQAEHMQHLRETNADLSHRLRVAKGHMEYMIKALFEIHQYAQENADYMMFDMIATRALGGKPTKHHGFNEYQEGKLVRWGLNNEGPGPMDPYDDRL